MLEDLINISALWVNFVEKVAAERVTVKVGK